MVLAGIITNLPLALLDELSLLLHPKIIEIVPVCVEFESILPIISIGGELGQSWRLIT